MKTKHSFSIRFSNNLNSNSVIKIHIKAPKFRAFTVGVGSLADISGKYYKKIYLRTLNQDDLVQLRGDWEAVGKEISESMNNIEKNLIKEPA